MPASLSSRDGQPVFAHHVQALQERQAKEDRELVGATLRRRRFRRQDVDAEPITFKGGRGLTADRSGVTVSFGRASPLNGGPRQQYSARIPHLDIKQITACYPPMKYGKVYPRFASQQGTAAEHFDYVTKGAIISFDGHLDYVCRSAAVEDLAAGLVIDMVDEIALRDEKNRLAVYSNIPGGRERQRSLFEAAESCESKPKVHELLASTASLAHMEQLEPEAIVFPGSMASMIRRLRKACEAAGQRAEKEGWPFRHGFVPIAEVTADEAYDWLTFFDAHRRGDVGKVTWKQGRTGRCQVRFVGELPHGSTPQERFAILQRFCDMLGSYGYMVVGAIHQPDPHGSSSNYHFHVDAYPRPAKWLDEHGCWDFEYSERRTGRTVYPYRQKKVRVEGGLNAEGKPARVNDAALIREAYIDIVDEVVRGREGVTRYLHGTYADNGIDLTPLEHMGNRTISAEKNGIETEVGTRNAHRIVGDQLRACERRADAQERELDREVELMRGLCAGGAHALRRVGEYEALCRRAIERRVQVELCDVIVDMARSRADVVIRTFAEHAPGQRRKAGEEALLKGAREHVGWVERRAPSQKERIEAERATAKIERQAEMLRTAIMSATVDRPMLPALRYRARERGESSLSPVHPAYADRIRDRLLRWIETHRDDSERLVISEDEVALGAGVQRSIDTLMRRFAADQAVQTALSRARIRRERAAAAKAFRAKPLEPLNPAETQMILDQVRAAEERRAATLPAVRAHRDVGLDASTRAIPAVSTAPQSTAERKPAPAADLTPTTSPTPKKDDRHEQRSDEFEDLHLAAQGWSGPAGLRQPLGEAVSRGRGFVGIAGVRVLPGGRMDGQRGHAGNSLPHGRRAGPGEERAAQDQAVRGSDRGAPRVAPAEGAGNPDDERCKSIVKPANEADLLQAAWQHFQGRGRGW